MSSRKKFYCGAAVRRIFLTPLEDLVFMPIIHLVPNFINYEKLFPYTRARNNRPGHPVM